MAGIIQGAFWYEGGTRFWNTPGEGSYFISEVVLGWFGRRGARKPDIFQCTVQ